MTSPSTSSRKQDRKQSIAERAGRVAGESANRWVIEVNGAPGTLYAGEMYQLQVDFPEHYPMEAPQQRPADNDRYVKNLFYKGNTSPVANELAAAPTAKTMLLRRFHSISVPFSTASPPLPRRSPTLLRRPISLFSKFALSSPPYATITVLSFSSCKSADSGDSEPTVEFPSKQGPLKPGLYLVGTPIGNLEDITLRALRVLKSADVILSEDTRHSGKLLHYYNIKTPLLSYHKFNESQREQVVLNRLQSGETVALISDAGMPGISDPGMELAKLCVDKDIPVVPIPGPSAPVAALSASGLPTNEFTFVGFLPRHATTRKKRLMVSANDATTQVFFVPPHKLCLFLEETCLMFGQSRRCVIAREMTKLHEEVKVTSSDLLMYLELLVVLVINSVDKFWRGTLGEAKEAFSAHQPKGEITLLIEGATVSEDETLSESQLENELRELISNGHSLSMAVKLVANETSMKRKAIYSLALEKFGKHGSDDEH
ncbi:hypothetical protein BUALT_Bualt08G0076000 [Buddleja alternifolia]|uniref:Tetrapyrrole methylase domain-containing protein n=1 Tax=Buddleja alternifolia TaxID=168488 RepID=A0AAV6X3Y5_9LAMI|nr:hypothetical protein BUALT_Bualt08G0076000 [Buddleja alternifolia]